MPNGVEWLCHINTYRRRTRRPSGVPILSTTQARQYRAFVQGNVTRFFALDRVLRFFIGRMANVSFVVYIPGMHFDYSSTHPSYFRIPAHAIANFE
jgi:hypothetical protein